MYVRPALIEHAACIMHGVINERCSANLEQAFSSVATVGEVLILSIILYPPGIISHAVLLLRCGVKTLMRPDFLTSFLHREDLKQILLFSFRYSLSRTMLSCVCLLHT